jgi:GTP-binding protein
VGVPNAGKSSLLSAVTNAKPKIADYPFTTLEPNLGVARLDEETDLILADIPGLIEGAHLGVGLGDAFLRHIQRTRVLVHVLDGSAEDPLADFSQINAELALFDAMLAQKPQVVVVNKIDLPEVKERWEDLRKGVKKRGYEAFAISALTRENLTPVLWKAHQLLLETPTPEVIPELPVYKPSEDPRDFTIEREGGGWRVNGKAIERAAEMTYWEHDGSVRRFHHLMEKLGVDEALRKQGIGNGEMVYILDYELEWLD